MKFDSRSVYIQRSDNITNQSHTSCLPAFFLYKKIYAIKLFSDIKSSWFVISYETYIGNYTLLVFAYCCYALLVCLYNTFTNFTNSTPIESWFDIYNKVTERKPGHSRGIWDRWLSGCARRTCCLIIGDQTWAKRVKCKFDNRLSCRCILWFRKVTEISD